MVIAVDDALWDRAFVSKYGWNLRCWIVRQIARFLDRAPPYGDDVLRYKVARFLLRDVRPQRRHDREALAEFYRWVTALVELVADAAARRDGGGENDPAPPWCQHVCGSRDLLESDRFELEEYGEPDSDDDH